jgi:hypothetical protein
MDTDMDIVWFSLFIIGFFMVMISIFKSQLKCQPAVEVVKYIYENDGSASGSYTLLKDFSEQNTPL